MLSEDLGCGADILLTSTHKCQNFSHCIKSHEAKTKANILSLLYFMKIEEEKQPGKKKEKKEMLHLEYIPKLGSKVLVNVPFPQKPLEIALH